MPTRPTLPGKKRPNLPIWQAPARKPGAKPQPIAPIPAPSPGNPVPTSPVDHIPPVGQPIVPDVLSGIPMPNLPGNFPSEIPGFPAIDVPAIPTFNPGQYLITDLFRPQSPLPQLSVEEHNQYMSALEGWNRALEVGSESMRTNTRIVNMGTLSVDGQIAVERYGRKQVDLQTEQVKSVQSGINYQREYHKTTGMRHELNGAMRAVPLLQQRAEARLDKLQREVYELQRDLGTQQIPEALPVYPHPA